VAFRVEVEPHPVLARLFSSGPGPSGAKAATGSPLIDTFFLEVIGDHSIVAFPRRMSDKAISKLAKRTNPQLLRESDPALAEFAAHAGAPYGVHVLVSWNPMGARSSSR
jgi:hypothetical protein